MSSTIVFLSTTRQDVKMAAGRSFLPEGTIVRRRTEKRTTFHAVRRTIVPRGKRDLLDILAAGCFFLAVFLIVAACKAGNAPTVSVQPDRDNAMLLNPGKGWVQYYGADKYTDDYISVGYTRWAWSDIEPKEGRFNWKAIDDFICLFKGHGKKTAFGVMNVSTGLGQRYVTPKWVFDAGAAPLAIADNSSPSGQQIIPKTWDDPVFLQKFKTFVRALGRRYDSNPDIAFINVRSYGNWGEGHIGMLKAPGIVLTPPENLKQNYFLPYIEAFPHTQLIIPWGSDLYAAVYDWAVARGAGMRRDGILSVYSKDGSECLRAHGRHPSVFEYCDGYGDMKKSGWWKPDMLKNTYFQGGKPSYMQWNPQIFEENRDFCLSLGNYVGYHFVLQRAVLPRSLGISRKLHLELQWLNDGVAYLYEPCSVAVALLNRHEKVVRKQWLSGSDPKHWTPGQARTETFDVGFPSLPADSYKVAVGLFLNRNDSCPAYRLGIRGRTADGWYLLYDGLLVRQ